VETTLATPVETDVAEPFPLKLFLNEEEPKHFQIDGSVFFQIDIY